MLINAVGYSKDHLLLHAAVQRLLLVRGCAKHGGERICVHFHDDVVGVRFKRMMQVRSYGYVEFEMAMLIGCNMTSCHDDVAVRRYGNLSNKIPCIGK
ncbi:hypothetical protein Tco_0540372 [Tanacetum coccineum]